MDTPNHIEFTAKKKEDGRTFINRALITSACIMPFFILTAFLLMFAQGLIVITAPAAILTIYLCWFTRRFTRIEYEYVVLSGDFSVSVIYDNMSRRDLFTVKISDMHKVVPFHANETILNTPDISRVLYYCSDLLDPDLYICVFDDEKKGRTALVFNTRRKFIEIMKFYNRPNVVIKDEFRY